MRILILTNHMDPGGIPAYVLTLARGFRNTPHEILVASGGGRWEKDLSDTGVRHFRLPLRSSAELNPGVLYSFFPLRRLIRTERIDLIHDQTRVTAVLGRFLAARTRIRRVSTCHGFFKRRFFRKRFPCWGDRVIAISPAVREHLTRDWELADDRIRLISHGVTVPVRSAPHPPEAAWRQSQGIPANACLLGCLGRLSPVKGFDVLIRALAEAASRGETKIHVCLVGEGPESRRLRTLARTRGLAARVHFVPSVPDKDAFFRALDIFCAPSRAEGLGLSVMEAMAHGLAVMASRVGGLSDLIEHARNGYLVNPEDAADLARGLEALGANEVLRGELGREARRHALDHFSVERMTHQTRAVYEEAAA